MRFAFHQQCRMNWSLIKQFPKYAIAVGLLLFSTVFFGLWWMLRSSSTEAIVEVAPLSIAELNEKMGGLVLVGNDLYEVVSGQLIAKNWLEGGPPPNIFYNKKTERLFSAAPAGFVQFSLAGKRLATLEVPSTLVVTDDLKTIFYAKAKDIWRAEVDFTDFKLINEHQITRMGTFYDRLFSDNLCMMSKKFLLFRNQNQLLRINIETGDVKPAQVSGVDLVRARSPDGQILLGMEGMNFFIYDLDGDEKKTSPVGLKAVTDYQWLDNNQCVLAVRDKGVALFDRSSSFVGPVQSLPIRSYRLGVASADQQSILCYNHQAGAVINLKTGVSELLPAGAQGIIWPDGESYLYACHIQDSDLRGTWIKTWGKDPQRLTPEPYLISRAGEALAMTFANSGHIIFINRQGLCRVKQDGSHFVVISPDRQPTNLLPIRSWEAD